MIRLDRYLRSVLDAMNIRYIKELGYSLAEVLFLSSAKKFFFHEDGREMIVKTRRDLRRANEPTLQ